MEPDLKSAPGLLKAAEAELNAPGALESKPRVMPDEVIPQVQALQRDLVPELDADEARPDGERVHDAAHRAVVRTTLAGLGDDALIYYAATLAWLATLPPPETERAERTKRMRAADDELFAYLWPRYRHHRIYGPMMVRIRSGVGRKDDAEDVLGLIAILRADLKDNPDALAGLPWTEADLTRMEADATRQLETLDEATPAENAARILRHRAWARIEQRHEIVRRAGLALTGDTRRYTHLKTA